MSHCALFLTILTISEECVSKAEAAHHPRQRVVCRTGLNPSLHRRHLSIVLRQLGVSLPHLMKTRSSSNNLIINRSADSMASFPVSQKPVRLSGTYGRFPDTHFTRGTINHGTFLSWDSALPDSSEGLA